MRIRRSRRLLTLLVVLALAACTPAAMREPITRLPAADEPTVPTTRQLMVMVPLAERRALAATTDALVAAFPVDVVALWPMDAIDLYCLVLAVEDDHDVQAVLATLREDPRVEIAQRLNLFETLAAPAGDPMLDLQPALRTSRVLAAHGVATGRGVRVAVVDSGIDTAHTELAGAVAATRNLVGGVDEVAAVVPERHGTAMAGVIAARRGNARGIVGVAPDAAILGLRACAQPAGAPRGRCTSFTVARALNAAFALDADIVNLSFAGPYDPTLARFIDAAEAAGRVLVAARADDDTAAFPAAAPTVLAVERARADGPDPSAALPAPGDDVVSTTPGDGYGVFGGASLAAAHVSGLAALVLQAAPALDPVDVRAVLTRAVRRGPGDAAVVDACRALAAAVDEAGATVATICATS